METGTSGESIQRPRRIRMPVWARRRGEVVSGISGGGWTRMIGAVIVESMKEVER